MVNPHSVGWRRAVNGTDRLSIYPFTGVLLAFSLSFFYIDFLKIYSFNFFLFFIFILSIFISFIDFFLLLPFRILFKFSFNFFLFSFLFFYPLSLLISFRLSFSPLGLFLIWVCVPVMSIDSKFVFEFIAWTMATMLVHSTCQKCIHICTWLALHLHVSTTFKGMRESFCCLASQSFSLSS